MQPLFASMLADGKSPKTIRNVWVSVRSIWTAAEAHGYVDQMLPSPKLPKVYKSEAKYFRLSEVGKIIATAVGWLKTFCWLAAETGLRASELCGLRISDVEIDRVIVREGIWHGRHVLATKNNNSKNRNVAVSMRLSAMLQAQIESQRVKGHERLFSRENGAAIDADTLVKRGKRKGELGRIILACGANGALNAFRHFNITIMDHLAIPLKIRKERVGHLPGDGTKYANVADITLDVYTHSDWADNVHAAELLSDAIEKVVSTSCEAVEQEKRLAGSGQQAFETV